jgi:hypothetical protein
MLRVFLDDAGWMSVIDAGDPETRRSAPRFCGRRWEIRASMALILPTGGRILE